MATQRFHTLNTQKDSVLGTYLLTDSPHSSTTDFISWRYQLADASAGVGYTFFATLAILYFMKLVVYLYRHYFTSDHTQWWAATDFTDDYLLEDRLEATQQQRWTLPTHVNGHGPYPIIQEPQQFESHTAQPEEQSAVPVGSAA
jgi:hypothetical protein